MSEVERWNNRFSSPEYLFGTRPNAFLERQKALLPPNGRALSLADGEGRNGVWLAEQGLDVVSLDASATALGKAEALARSRNVSLTVRLADLTRWQPFETDLFDVVVLIFAQFLSPDERTRVFAQMAKSLKPGGLLLLEGYRPEQLAFATGGPKMIENLYTRAMLEAAFDGFSSLHVDEYDARLEEGSGHVGMSALIDVVAIK